MDLYWYLYEIQIITVGSSPWVFFMHFYYAFCMHFLLMHTVIILFFAVKSLNYK